VRSRRYRYILFGGAMSGGKSYLMAMMFLSMAQLFPRTRYGIFRRNLTVLKRTTYQTFRKVAFEMGLLEGVDYTINRADMVWEFTNGSQIFFMELDETKDPDFNKVKGLELTAAGIDEANEVLYEAFLVVSSRVGRENRNGELAFVFMTCNPDKNWVDDQFYTPWTNDALQPPHLFVPALPADNPHNSAEYLAALNAMPLAFRARYVEGNWRYIDDPNALFPMRLLDMMTVDHLPKTGSRTSGNDVAREGDDNNVFSLIIKDTLADLTVPDVEVGDEIPILNQLADEYIQYLKTNNVGYQHAWVDAVGVGGGVVDNCRKRGYWVAPQ
jgi:phage terminase large subunit